MYKLIVSDIDSTLINSKFEIPDYNVKMIKRAIDHGVDFMLCTGRLFGSARPYAKHLDLNTPIITSNGAITMDWRTKKHLFSKPLNPKICTELFDILDELDLYYHFYASESFYTRKFLYEGSYISKMNQDLPEEERFPTLETDDPSGVAMVDPVYKISVRCTEKDEIERFQKIFSERTDVDVTSSFAGNYEISATGVNKGNALKKYTEMLGIAPDEIMTFGDNYNDIEMIKFAGTGVAVGNAVDELKAAADFIADTNEDNGVGKAIAKFVFGE